MYIWRLWPNSKAAITILTEEVKDDHLAYLKSIEVSYIFAGKDKIDLKIALKKLKQLFGIERVLCEGWLLLTDYY